MPAASKKDATSKQRAGTLNGSRGSKEAHQVVTTAPGQAGRRKREWHSGFKTKREAEAARIEILANLQRGEHVSPDKVTVRAFLEDEWLCAMGPSLRASTYEGYKLDGRWWRSGAGR